MGRAELDLTERGNMQRLFMRFWKPLTRSDGLMSIVRLYL